MTIAFLSCYRIYRPVPRCCDAVREVCLAAADAVRRLAQFGPLAHVGALAQLGPHLARRYADVLRRRKV